MKKFHVFGVAILAIALLCAACGQAAPAAGAITRLKVEMSEFTFMPASYSVPAGKQITLELKNSGSITHDFLILKKGVTLQGKFDRDTQAQDVYFDASLDSQKTQTFTFTAPTEPGDYQVICGVPGHFQSGMTATLTVVGQ